MMKIVQKIKRELINLIKPEQPQAVVIQPDWKPTSLEVCVAEPQVIKDMFLLSDDEFLELLPVNGYFH